MLNNDKAQGATEYLIILAIVIIIALIVVAVMGGAQAAKVLLQIEVSSLKSKGEKITPEREKELYNNIKEKYDQQASPYYAASRLWIDEIIDPLDTRKWISMGIEAADHSPIKKPFNVGVIQT